MKGAARFQFLARYLDGEGVDGLRLEVPATRGKMGKTTFYNFLMSPYDLMKIAYVAHKSADLDSYQRMVKPGRLKQIAEYIDGGSQFPTNIVINFKTKDGKPLQFDKHESYEGSTFGTLKLPGLYGSAWVVDGQHRLYGFSFADKGQNHVVPVLAYENMDPEEEMQLFIDINSKQVKVSGALLNELYANLHHGSKDPLKQFGAMYPRIALRLGNMSGSPLRNRILTTDRDKDNFRCLSLKSLRDGIEENRLLGSLTRNATGQLVSEAGPLSAISGDNEETVERAADILAGYFDLFAKGVPANWDLGDAKGGFLCINIGLRALLRLLRRLINHVETRENVKAQHLSPSEFVGLLAPLVTPVIDYFSAADPVHIKAFRDRQALDGVTKNCLALMAIVHDVIPEFTNAELMEYLKDRDEAGTVEVGGLIKKINKLVYDDLVGRLTKKCGTEKDAWFWSGVPSTIRKQCINRADDIEGQQHPWHHLLPSAYADIVVANWDVFGEAYSLGEKIKKRANAVAWMHTLEKLKETTEHPARTVLSKDEVAWVKEIYGKVLEFIVGREASVAA